MNPPRLAGSVWCSWGTGGDYANGCENVALPPLDLCPGHEKISQYLESIAVQCPEDWDEYVMGEWELKPTPGWTEDDALAAMGPA